MKVLVTGGSGFIGSNLIESLEEEGKEVINYDVEEGRDITDFNKLEQAFEEEPEQVYHLAALPYWVGEENPYRDIRVNLFGTINVLKLVDRFNCPLLYTSSSSVYGNSSRAKEEDPYRPITNYGISKTAAEMYVRKWRVDAKITRFSSIYGPNTYGVVNKFIEKIRNGEPLTIYGSGEQTRDFCHVDDAVQGVRLAMRKGEPGEVYNVGTGRENSINDLAQIFREYTGAEIQHVSHRHEKSDLKKNSLDIGKIKKLGYRPRTSLKEGIRRILEP